MSYRPRSPILEREPEMASHVIDIHRLHPPLAPTALAPTALAPTVCTIRAPSCSSWSRRAGTRRSRCSSSSARGALAACPTRTCSSPTPPSPRRPLCRSARSHATRAPTRTPPARPLARHPRARSHATRAPARTPPARPLARHLRGRSSSRFSVCACGSDTPPASPWVDLVWYARCRWADRQASRQHVQRRHEWLRLAIPSIRCCARGVRPKLRPPTLLRVCADARPRRIRAEVDESASAGDRRRCEEHLFHGCRL